MRANAAETDALLRRSLGAEVLEGVEAPPNYSVVLAHPDGARGPLRGLHLLYRSSRLVLRTRDPERLVHGLAAWLSSHLDEHEHLRIWSAAAVHEGRALLVPGHVMTWLKVIQPRLNRLGVQLVDEPFALVDPATAELVVPEPVITVDAAALSAYGPASRGGEPPRVVPGRYPLREWLVWDSDTSGPLTGPRAVVAAWTALDPGDDRAGELEAASSLVENVPMVAANYRGAKELAKAIEAAVDRRTT